MMDRVGTEMIAQLPTFGIVKQFKFIAVPVACGGKPLICQESIARTETQH